MLAPLDIWLTGHGRQGALSEKGDRTRSITLNLGFKPESSLQEFFRQQLIRPLGRPADDRGDAAAIFEQTTLVLWLEPNVRETGRCSTVQKRLLRLEKLWPAPAALAAGFRPQKITSRPLPRIAASYLIKLHPRPPARLVVTQRATGNSARASSKKALGLPLDRHGLSVFSMILARSRQPSP